MSRDLPCSSIWQEPIRPLAMFFAERWNFGELSSLIENVSSLFSIYIRLPKRTDLHPKNLSNFCCGTQLKDSITTHYQLRSKRRVLNQLLYKSKSDSVLVKERSEERSVGNDYR